MDNIYEIVKEVRKRIFKTAYFGQVGHIASALSAAEIISVLYFKEILKYKPLDPNWEQRDKFILSKGHACLALYSVLNMAGYFSEKELYTFCKPGSKFGGEPKINDVPGVEASTGSLGHGLSFALGIAMANKMDSNKANSKVYVMIGDGECEEGTIWEAAISAVKFKLDNLIVILDNNKLQAMGKVSDIMAVSSWTNKWEAFGWDVEEIDGHNVEEIYNSLNKKNILSKPRIIIANTIKGKGISFMENVPIWHFRMPNDKELKIVMEELDIREQELTL